MEAQPFVLQFAGSKFEQPDLGSHLEPDRWIAGLLPSHVPLRKDRPSVLADHVRRAQASRAIPPVALGIEAIPPGLANRMAKSSWSVAGLTAPEEK